MGLCYMFYTWRIGENVGYCLGVRNMNLVLTVVLLEYSNVGYYEMFWQLNVYS
jgi:hypothetical protein